MEIPFPFSMFATAKGTPPTPRDRQAPSGISFSTCSAILTFVPLTVPGRNAPKKGECLPFHDIVRLGNVYFIRSVRSEDLPGVVLKDLKHHGSSILDDGLPAVGRGAQRAVSVLIGQQTTGTKAASV